MNDNLEPNMSAKQRFDAACGADEADPIERLRFFCSLAMTGDDWIDVEPFFSDLVQAKAEQVTHQVQAAEVQHLNEVLRRKNIALDALHYVWCDGGCETGTHRYVPGEITEEIVLAAERNTARLRRWFDNKQSKRERTWT